MNKIPIYFTFDNKYVVPAAVAFYSLLSHTKEDVCYDLYVLHEDITQENEQLLQEIVTRFSGACLTFVNTEGFLKEEWEKGNFEGHQKRGQFTRDTVMRCFGSKFLPQYDKIIYSDVDVIFVDDVSELYNVNLDGKYVAAVKDALMAYEANELSHLPTNYYEKLKDTYFGGGIFVLNADLIRHDNLEKEMIRIIMDNSIPKRWLDQDILNIACKNKVEYLSLSYVSLPYLIDWLKNPNFSSHYSKEELWNSILKPKIIHFAGVKPWRDNTSYSGLWWSYWHYLNLPRTSIFNPLESAEHKKECRYKKKIRKYRRIAWVSLGFLALLLSFCLCLLGKIIKLP